jgi:hypothetical protein
MKRIFGLVLAVGTFAAEVEEKKVEIDYSKFGDNCMECLLGDGNWCPKAKNGTCVKPGTECPKDS